MIVAFVVGAVDNVDDVCAYHVTQIAQAAGYVSCMDVYQVLCLQWKNTSNVVMKAANEIWIRDPSQKVVVEVRLFVLNVTDTRCTIAFTNRTTYNRNVVFTTWNAAKSMCVQEVR